MTRTNLVLSTADAPAWPASWRFQAYATTAPSGQTTGMCSPHELLRDRSDSLKTPDSSSCLPNINQKTQFQKRRNPNNGAKVVEVLAHGGVFFEEQVERFVALVRLRGDEQCFQESIGAEPDIRDKTRGVAESVHCLSHLFRRCLLGRWRTGAGGCRRCVLRLRWWWWWRWLLLL